MSIHINAPKFTDRLIAYSHLQSHIFPYSDINKIIIIFMSNHNTTKKIFHSKISIGSRLKNALT